MRSATRSLITSSSSISVGPLAFCACLAVSGLVLPGCGGSDFPPLGRVTGKVTIGGEPLTGVIVVFQPSEGRPAVGTTGADGTYELMYVAGVKGCKAGPTEVSFATPTGGSPSHPIPAKYQGKTGIDREVLEGSNTFDFELEPEGGVKPKPNAGKVPKTFD